MFEPQSNAELTSLPVPDSLGVLPKVCAALLKNLRGCFDFAILRGAEPVQPLTFAVAVAILVALVIGRIRSVQLLQQEPSLCLEHPENESILYHMLMCLCFHIQHATSEAR